MDSKIGLIIQLNGVFVIAVLCFLLARSLKITALKYWTVAWLSLSFALISLRLSFTFDLFERLLWTYYYLGQYFFGLLLIAGCRALAGDWQIDKRSEILVVPFLILSIALPYATSDFYDVFIIHSLVMATIFATAFFALRRVTHRSIGWKVTSVALAALSIELVLYSGSLIAGQFIPFDSSFITFAPVADLVLQTTLGFGMVIVLLEKVLSETKSAHQRLESANQRLEELVTRDPLTAAFSRHAFYGFVKKHGDNNSETSGCVGFFDIDDLKHINDSYGHAAGDAAIRTVARGIREIVRAEDLIFRWGGDEFFVIMIGMDADMALLRMTKLDALLTGVFLDGSHEPVDINVSWGFTDFCDISVLEEAINRADAAMYSRKLERKERSKNPPAYTADLQPSPSVSAT